MPDDRETRDRVRALVRDVLNNALPAEEDAVGGGAAPNAAAPERAATPPASASRHRPHPRPRAASSTSRLPNGTPARKAKRLSRTTNPPRW